MFIQDKPYDWRDGQTIFNFLEWLKGQSYPTEQSSRMADPFLIPNKELEELYQQFLLTIND